MSKKQQVLTELYLFCQEQNNYIFDNNLVKDIAKKIGFGNPFDVTKIDNKHKLPKILLDNDYAVIHLGNGIHRFVKGIENFYHDFEEINTYIDWEYKKSLLNQFNSSESNVLSIANNQLILHDFLFGNVNLTDPDILQRPKTYFPHRTKSTLNYSCNSVELTLNYVQIEIDLTIEFQGKIGVFEAKNDKSDNFVIYQIYHPYLYYHNANNSSSISGKITEIYGVYVVKVIENQITCLKLWAYTFNNPFDITSIMFVKATCYRLMQV